MYTVRPPILLRLLYPQVLWRVETKEKELFLTFDDGPEPEVTPKVLDILSRYGIKATFFMLGQKATAYPDLVKEVLRAGHRIGHHSQSHSDGWKVPQEEWLADVDAGANSLAEIIGKPVPDFRPPYGKFRPGALKEVSSRYRIVMWDVMSGDFDPKLSSDQCLQRTVKNSRHGSLVVFHESQQSWALHSSVLERYIHSMQKKGYRFSVIRP